MPKLDWFLAKRPLTTDIECGDAGILREFDNKIFITLFDVLGHASKNVHKIVIIIEEYLEKNYRKELIEIIKGLHEHIMGSRGVAIGLGLLDLKTGELKYVGVGNIIARKFGSSTVRIIPRSGIVGYIMPDPREEIIKLYDGDILVLYTDGVKESFELEDYPELLKDDAKTIATHLIHQFGKEEDDAACIALRVRGGGLKNQKND